MKNKVLFPRADFAGKSGENSVSLVDATRFPVAEVARLQGCKASMVFLLISRRALAHRYTTGR